MKWHTDIGKAATIVKFVPRALHPSEMMDVVLPRNWALCSAAFGGIFIRHRIRPLYEQTIDHKTFRASTTEAYFATLAMVPRAFQ